MGLNWRICLIGKLIHGIWKKCFTKIKIMGFGLMILRLLESKCLKDKKSQINVTNVIKNTNKVIEIIVIEVEWE